MCTDGTALDNLYVDRITAVYKISDGQSLCDHGIAIVKLVPGCARVNINACDVFRSVPRPSI